MKEKDIEKLIAEHPKEFFLENNFKLKEQQMKLGPYYADIIFEDENGGNVIIEVKVGILTREKLVESIGQIIDYYGILKEKEPDKPITQKIIIANFKRPERELLIAEKLGIQIVEISPSKIQSVAKKYNYRFSDSPSEEEIKAYRDKVKVIEKSVASRTSKVWLFQAKPEIYDIQKCLADKDIIQNEDVWEINKYRSEIKKGDGGVIWMSGKYAGIYGIIEIMSDPEYMKDSDYISSKYWVDEGHKDKIKWRVKFSYKINLINNPIMKIELKNIPELQNMAIFKFAQGTNFPITPEEWEILSNLIKKKL